MNLLRRGSDSAGQALGVWGILLFLGFVVAVLGCGWALGRASSGEKTVQARSDSAVCDSALQAKSAAVADLQQRLEKITRDQVAQGKAADSALAARDAQINHLRAQAAARERAIQKEGGHDPTCSNLARLPVCPAVARRLWGAQDDHAPGSD